MLMMCNSFNTEKCNILFSMGYDILDGLGSIVGIAAGYGLDGLGIESQRRQDFPHLSRSALRPSLLHNRYQVFPRGEERPGRDADPSPPSSAVGHERVKLYLYSPCGSYGLYKGALYLFLNLLVHPIISRL